MNKKACRINKKININDFFIRGDQGGLFELAIQLCIKNIFYAAICNTSMSCLFI
jgi:hypothetical protein